MDYLNLSITFTFSSTFPTISAGLPTTKENEGTSFVTTAPAPIKEYSPIETPALMVEFAPTLAPLPTTMG